jgi:RNA polymerase sigma-70 factor, ECF subfamily
MLQRFPSSGFRLLMCVDCRKLSDAEQQALVERCRTGDREAFRQLYDSYQESVFSISLYYLNGDRSAAEDVTQTVFVRLYGTIKDFRQTARFTTWLYSMVANACRDEHRRRKRLVEWAPEHDLRPDGSQTEDGLALQHTVRQVVAELQPDFRITVLLKYFEDLSYEEIAEVLGCQAGTVASRLNRCHKILARKLSGLNPNAQGAPE